MDEATQETAALDDDQQTEPDENALDVFDRSISSLASLADAVATSGVTAGDAITSLVSEMQGQFVAQSIRRLFAGLGDGDGQTGIAAIMDSPPYASAFGIKGPPLRERVVSVDWATGFGFDVPIDRGSDPANWPECVRRYLGTSDLAMHLYDHFRTRITPGADPRAEWERGRGAGFETGQRTRPRGIMILDASSRSDAYRYVPDDVRRWRDPEHRAALTARAREYASYLPGRRA